MNGEAGAAPGRQPLDEVMMAMDVVDTLRRRERLVESELSDADRRAELKDRLREIYQSQGIEVSDRILEEGVAALTENRFVFDPPADSLGVRLARIYVSRLRWGKWVAGGLAVIAAILVFNYVTVTRPNARLGADLASISAEIETAADAEAARAQADDLARAGQAALASGDTDGARQALLSLRQLRDAIGAAYVVRVVNRPGEMSGVWRVPDVNTDARNYYLIVEAIDASGDRVQVPILNEETGRVETVATWGIRVDEATFDAVAADKRDDGIIQSGDVGRKRAGKLDPDYAIDTPGGAITEW